MIALVAIARCLFQPINVSRRADSNRLPLLITSVRSGVAGVCRGLQIPHIWATFSAAACCLLHRIAFAVVSEWYQEPALESGAFYEGAALWVRF